MLVSEQKSTLINKFSNEHQYKVGSTEIQIVLLTVKITKLQNHLNNYKHDYNTHRSLIKIICQRKKILKYLKNKHITSYQQILKQLNLRK